MSLHTIAVGLAIFEKYGGTEIAAEHDVIFAAQANGVAISDDDLATLKNANWFIDSDFCSCSPKPLEANADVDDEGRPVHESTCTGWSHFT